MEYVLDTSLLLGGRDPPPGGWWTTPEADGEIRPGGVDHRRYERWKAAGLRVESADAALIAGVQAVASAAGNLGRLSLADVSLVALALGKEAVLVTDDHTMLDVARRMRIKTLALGTGGIKETKDFKPRCTGCGRWLTTPATVCPICGSPVRLRPA